MQATSLPNPFSEKAPPLVPDDIDSCAEHLSDASMRLRLFKLRLGVAATDTAKASLTDIVYELRLIQRLARQINNLCTDEIAQYPAINPIREHHRAGLLE